MATQTDADVVENIIGYFFRSREYLVQALTAAGAEEDNHDGNRKLSHLGGNVIRFTLSFVAFETMPSRSQITDIETSIVSNTKLASIARTTGIDKHVKYSTKPGARSSKVLALAVNAIVGAVYIDSADFNASWRVTLRLGLISADLQGSCFSPTLSLPDIVDPAALSLNHSAAVKDVEKPLDQISNSDTRWNTSIPFNEQLDRGFATTSSPTSERSLGIPSNVFPDLVTPSADEAMWTSLWMDLNGGCISPEEVNDTGGNIDSACVGPGISPLPSSLPSVPRDGDEIYTSSSGQRDDRPENDRKRIKSHHHKRLFDDRVWSSLSEEAKKCQSHQHPLPYQTFFSPPIRDALIDMGANANRLAKFLVYIASAESIVTLRRIVLKYRGSASPISFGSTPDLSTKERWYLIGLLGENITWCRLFRMYHVLELYEACGGTRSTDKLILTTPSSFRGRKRKAGNPLYDAEMQITKKMMEEIFPDLRPDTDGYSEKHAYLKRVRKLGQRLHILTMKFGKGVLGLMLSDELTSLGISEQMILVPSDGTFESFVEILNRSQGDRLRSFSAAVQKILHPLINGTLPSETYAIEKHQPEEILGLPKGSDALLEQIK